MNTYSVAVYFLGVLVVAGVAVALFFRLRHAASDLEEKILGIWTNEANTLRMLIYSIESRFQAEIVWTRKVDEGILGSRIIGHMNLKCFSRCEGLYIDPYTKDQFNFRMKVKNDGLLFLHLFEKTNSQPAKVEVWRQVAIL